MGTLNEAMLVEFKADLKDMLSGFKKTKKESKKTSDYMVQKFKSAGKKMGSVFLGLGKSVTKWGALAGGVVGIGGVGMALTKAVTSAAKAETAFTKVMTLFKEGEIDALAMKKAIDELGISMGFNAVESADAFYQAVSAGFRKVDDAKEVVEAAMKASIAGFTGVPTSVEAITRVLNAYGLAGSEATKVSDLLFQTVNYGVTTFAELAPQIGMVATTAAKAGVPIEELFATLAALTKGMPTPEAVTSLNAMIMGFLKPTDDATKSANKWGVELSQAGIAAKGLVGNLKLMSSMSAEVQAELFPNIRALRGVMVASADGASELTTNLVSMSDTADITEVAFGRVGGTISHQWNLLTQSIGWFLQKIGEAFLPEIKDITKWFNNEVGPLLLQWAEDLKTKMAAWREAFAEETTGMSMKEKMSKAWADFTEWWWTVAWEDVRDVGYRFGRVVFNAIWDAMFSNDMPAFVKAWKEQLDTSMTQLESYNITAQLMGLDDKGFSNLKMETIKKTNDLIKIIKKDLEILEGDEIDFLNLDQYELNLKIIQSQTEEAIKEMVKEGDKASIINWTKQKSEFSGMIKTFSQEAEAFAKEMESNNIIGHAFIKGAKAGWIAYWPSLYNTIMGNVFGLRDAIIKALTFGGQMLLNALNWGVPSFGSGGWVRGYQTGGWVSGQPGPDMVPAQLTAGEAVIAPNVAQHSAYRGAVEQMIAAGQSGSTYHDASVNSFHFGSRVDKEFIIDNILPEITNLKKSGYSLPAW